MARTWALKEDSVNTTIIHWYSTQTTDLKKILEECVLDSHVTLSLAESASRSSASSSSIRVRVEHVAFRLIGPFTQVVFFEYQCIMVVFTLSSLSAQVRAIYVNRIKGSCPK